MGTNSHWKFARAYKAMKALGYSKETVQPILKNLYGLYEKNWDLIEEQNYSVLLEAILEGEEKMKDVANLNSWLGDDESEEDEVPLKRSSSAPLEPDSRASETYMTQGNDQVFSQQRMVEGGGGISTSPQQPSPIVEKPDCTEELSHDENDQTDHLFVQDSCLISTKGTPPPLLNMSKTASQFECNADDPVKEELSNDHPDGSSNENGGHSLEFPDSEPLYREGKQHHSSGSSQLDIASSPGGEVKISLICKSSSQLDFCAPILNAVVERVDEECIKSYGMTQPGFSFMKLMKFACECFLAADTIPNGETSSSHAQSTDILPVKHNKKPISFGYGDHQPIFCITSDYLNGSVIFQNLIRVRSSIPTAPRSNMLQTIFITRGINRKRTRDAEEYGKSKTKSPKILGSSTASTSCNQVVVWKQQPSYKPFYFVEDISKGEEELKISLVNEFNQDSPPPFMYIPRNAVFKEARVKFLLSLIPDDNCCSCCFGDCLSMEKPCPCAGKTGGEFAYTPDHLLKENFLEYCISMKKQDSKIWPEKCNGHRVRKFIKECWHRCGCSKKCGNRVVQRGIAVKLQVFMTQDGKGWGVRALENLPKGTFVCEYVGEIVTNSELHERSVKSGNEKHTYPVLLDAGWSSERVLKDEEALSLDATRYGNVARFINHRCVDANLVEMPVEVETPDHHYYHMALFTTRNVIALEELTWDYGMRFNNLSLFNCAKM